MRVVVCPTEFKESLDVRQVVEAMSDGVLRASPGADIVPLPVSDGGPGLLEALRRAGGGEWTTHRVAGPLGEPARGRVLRTPAGEAVLEAADACGLHLMPPDRRDPLRAHTRGVGELIARALEEETSTIVVGLGGSGTVDGGTGMAAELGYRFIGSDGAELPPGGGPLAGLRRIESPRRTGSLLESPANGTEPVRAVAVADVRTPLIGPDGAARTFGPQKGADPAAVERLELGLTRLSDRLVADLGRDVAGIPGSGAAGGLGAGCAAFLGATLVSGSDWVLERVGFDAALAAADLVVTGEGSFDATSGLGKIVGEVVHRATSAGVPVVLACGSISGTLPPGVHPISGEGRWLDAEGIARGVAGAVARVVANAAG